MSSVSFTSTPIFYWCHTSLIYQTGYLLFYIYYMSCALNCPPNTLIRLIVGLTGQHLFLLSYHLFDIRIHLQELSFTWVQGCVSLNVISVIYIHPHFLLMIYKLHISDRLSPVLHTLHVVCIKLHTQHFNRAYFGFDCPTHSSFFTFLLPFWHQNTSTRVITHSSPGLCLFKCYQCHLHPTPFSTDAIQGSYIRKVISSFTYITCCIH